ncbi:MAG: 4Fe-4S binding protein [Candidatus Dormibacteria bacterium]
MPNWIRQGLRTGIVTTRYPAAPDPLPTGTLGHLVVDPERCRPAAHGDCAAACPTGAISVDASTFRLDLGLCIQCARCVPACPAEALAFSSEQEVAVRSRADLLTEVTQR